MRAQVLLPLVPLALLAACGEAGNAPVGDAAGGLEGPDRVLNAVTEDVFSVGSISGGDWDAFSSVNSVAFDGESNLHILDAVAKRIHAVGPDGSLLRTVGGPGEGPGEFSDPMTLEVARDGGYTVIGITAIDLFEPGGAFDRRISMDPMTTGILNPLARTLPDGRIVAASVMRFGRIVSGDGEAEEGGRPIEIFPLDGGDFQRHYTAWELPEDGDHGGVEGGGPGVIRLSAGRAFEPGLRFRVLTDGRLAVTDSIGYRVKLIGLDGSVTGTIERPIAPLMVNDAIMEAERERYRNSNPQVFSSGGRRMEVEREDVEGRTFAEEVPVIGGLAVDWEDRIWVTRTGLVGANDGPIDIVTPEGDYIGTLPPDGLRTPAAFGPDGLMAFIDRDEFDVPTVRVVRLVALEPVE